MVLFSDRIKCACDMGATEGEERDEISEKINLCAFNNGSDSPGNSFNLIQSIFEGGVYTFGGFNGTSSKFNRRDVRSFVLYDATSRDKAVVVSDDIFAKRLSMCCNG